jgi:adenine/guanine phosphoribosyltransferase-like PRPP-binding protein
MTKRRSIISVDEDSINKLQVMYLLRALRRFMSLKDLANIIGLDETLISKYIHGVILPGPRRAKELLITLSNSDLVNKLLVETVRGMINAALRVYPDILNLASLDIDLINYYVLNLIKKLNGIEATKIITVEGGGLLISGLIASYTSLDLVYCLRDKYIPNSLIEYIRSENPAYSNFLSLPMVFSKNDRAIIVDDIIITGTTVKTLYMLARRAHVKISAIVTLIINERIIKKLKGEVNSEIIYELII